MTTTTLPAEILECSACGKNTGNGLELMPSGRNFKRHIGVDGERCTGGNPQSLNPEPVEIEPVKAGTPTDCPECGETHPALKAKGKVRKHLNPMTLDTCEQRPVVEVECPICQRKSSMKKGKLPLHKDMVKKTRCPASSKTMLEAMKLDKAAPDPKPKQTQPAAAKPPKAKAPVSDYKAKSPLEKSRYKATRLGEELAQLPQHPWVYTLRIGKSDQDEDQVTLVLTRGEEEMRISWWGGACYGGEGKITHVYKGRTIAVRNANAVRQRAAMSPEQVEAERARTTRQRTTGPRKKKTPEEMREVMPFDPKTADDDTILKAVLGRTVKWERTVDGKVEDDVVKGKPSINVTKTGLRNLTFRGQNTTRTVRVEKLVSVS